MKLARKPLTRHLPVRLLTTLGIVVGVLAVVGGLAAPVRAQGCGSTVDCPSSALPLPLQPMAHTETLPTQNVFVLETTPVVSCIYPWNPYSDYITGVNQLNVGLISETMLFTHNLSPGVGGNRLQVPHADGSMGKYALSGTKIHAAGVGCVPGVGDAFAITDKSISAVWSRELQEWIFPGGVRPLSAALVGHCDGAGSNWLPLCVETTAQTIEVVVGGSHSCTYTWPEPPVPTVPPDSYTNGPNSGVVVYTNNRVYLGTGCQAMIGTDLPYGYLSHAPGGGGIIVQQNFPGNPVTITLPLGSTVVPFQTCVAPLKSCGAGVTPSGVAVNTAPCPNMAGASATWPAAAALCTSTGGVVTGLGTFSGVTFVPSKWGFARAYAMTTVSGEDEDPDPASGRIWNYAECWKGGTPGTKGPRARASALVLGGADAALGMAWIDAWYDPATEGLRIRSSAQTLTMLIHALNHVAWAWGIASDPIVITGWDDADDLEIDFTLLEDTFLTMPDHVHPYSTTWLGFTIGSTLPDLTELYEVSITVAQDDPEPTMDVTFTSNPLLGLDDLVVGSAIAAAFSYDPADQGYRVLADTTIFSLAIDVLPGTDTFEVGNDLSQSSWLLEPGYDGPDPTPPTILEPPVVTQDGTGAVTIVFLTDEETRATVYYGSSCNDWIGVARGPDHTLAPTVVLPELPHNGTYYFAVKAVDAQGQATYDDDGGGCYTFTVAPNYFTELFEYDDNDVDHLSLTFVPDGSDNFYQGCVEQITALPTDPAGGTSLELDDNDSVLVVLDEGYTVSFYDASYDSFYVGSNGYLTFDSSDTEYNETLAHHFDYPRISGLFDDLDPSDHGTVSWKQLEDRVAVTYQEVPELGAPDYNTFQIELYFDGTITISYLTISALDGLAGLSAGLGLDPGFQETDLSGLGPYCGPEPPTAADGSVYTPFNTPITIAVAATDDGLPHTPGALTYVVTALPAHGELSVSQGELITDVPYTVAGGSNLLKYAPDSSHSGADSFQFKADDGGTPPEGGDSNESTVSITVGIPGDCDGNGEVNLDDFAAFFDCLTGPDGGPADEDCQVFDFDADNDLDLADSAWLQREISSPDPIGACCDDSSGECIDDVPLVDCPAPLRFAADMLCADLDPPCGE